METTASASIAASQDLGSYYTLKTSNANVHDNRVSSHLNHQNYSTPTQQKRHLDYEQNYPVTVTPEDRYSDNDMPFDVRNSMIEDVSHRISSQKTPTQPITPVRNGRNNAANVSPTSTRGFESIWESSPEREGALQGQKGISTETRHPSNHSSEAIDTYHDNRFMPRPPRFSDPALIEVTVNEQDNLVGNKRGGERDGLEESVKNMNSMVDHLEKLAIDSKGHAVDSQENRRMDKYDRRNLEPTQSLSFQEQDEISELQTQSSALRDEDSIFDFEEEVRQVSPQFPDPSHKPVNITHKIRRRTKYQRKLDTETDDDTSLEFSYGPRQAPSPTNLQERSQQAWKSRREKSSSLKSKQDPRRTKPSSVSFGALDTVHHFEPDIVEEDENEDDTYQSYEDRSSNSEYTKSIESEVEDMIRDILFIGNGQSSQPGRRKAKRGESKQKTKRKSQKAAAEAGDEDYCRANGESQANASDDVVRAPRSSSENTDQSRARSRREQNRMKIEEEDPLLYVWDFVSGGVDAVSNALGLTEDINEEPLNAVLKNKKDEKESTKPQERTETRSVQQRGCNDYVPFITGGSCTGQLQPSQGTKEGMQEMVEYTQDFLYGPLTAGSESYGYSASLSKDSANEVGDTVNESKIDQVDQAAEEQTYTFSSVENDVLVAQLAIHAARSVHHLQGVQYDESDEIDMYNDIKMSVVELKLPLGLIFLENDGGCFVTKVSPDGSAARSGGVEVGDQLAAINGHNSSKMKVDDICSLIAESPKRTSIELVFIRYIGPFRPLDEKGNEGFELEASNFDRSVPQRSTETEIFESDHAKKKGFRWFGLKKKRKSKQK